MEEEEDSLQRALADIEIVSSAYPDEVTTTDSQASCFPLHFTINLNNDSATITLELLSGYPVNSGIQITNYRSNEKNRMEATIKAVRQAATECQQDGVEGGFACCSAAIDTWKSFDDANEDVIQKEDPEQNLMNNEKTIYEWVSGEPMTEKKSTFQAHLCRVENEYQVREALHQLITSSSKIQRATHNMYAWRIKEIDGGREIHKHDNDDDGEDAAGSKLAYLLDIRKDENVLVVVSRWYGGIHLGPKRFQVITNVARQLLVDHFGDNNNS